MSTVARWGFAGLAAWAAAAAPLRAEEKQPPLVDQVKVNQAIAKGMEFLLARLKEGLPEIMDTSRVKVEARHGGQSYNELVLYTLLHAGVKADDPELLKLVQDTRARPLAHTYGTAIRAQAFEKFDPALLKGDILQCAQFLIDNQSEKGYWGYSKAVPLPPLPPVNLTPQTVTLSPGGDHAAPLAVSADRKTQAIPKKTIARRGWGEERDNSNTQYAMLGLAACMAAGFWPPADTFTLVEKHLTGCQKEDGGWGYREGEKDHSYGAMTAGGVSSLGICLRARNQDPMKDVRIRKGLEWLGKNLAFDKHPEGDEKWQFYWIYSVERAGAFAGTPWFGDRPWYSEGATWLLANQKPDGSWEADKKNKTSDTICDTCWAILFLKQASRRYVTYSKS
jgi:hypothetical protein